MCTKSKPQTRKIKYVEAINEAFHQIMESNDNVFVLGVGVNSPWYVGRSMSGLYERFGPDRVIDPPVAENGITGIAIGAALAGMRPVVVHPRMDFMYLAMDQIVNHAASWHYMFGGRVNVPVTIRGIVNRGGEQAAQHSQNLAALFMHVPGLKLVAPSTAYDAKGLLIASILDDNPVIYIDDRWLYENQGQVPQDVYEVPIGKAIVSREGDDITIVATSYLVWEAVRASEILQAEGISAEVIDLRSLKPLDTELLFASVAKTARLLIADGTWKTCGVAAEISSCVAENIFDCLRAPVARITLPDTPAPASSSLEKCFYPRVQQIVLAARDLLDYRRSHGLQGTFRRPSAALSKPEEGTLARY